MSITVAPARPYRRGVELALVFFAGVLAAGALAEVLLAHNGMVNTDLAYLGGGFLALYLIAHFAIRRLAPAADPLLLPIMALLNGIGLAEIYRIDLANADTARRQGKPAPHSLAQLQLGWTVLAVAALIVVLLVVRDHRVVARYSYTAAFVGIGLLLLLAVPGIGKEVNGARIELKLGPIPFQPSEFSKILLLIFFASYLGRKRDALSMAERTFLGLPLPRGRDLGPLITAWIASLLVLVAAKDLGTSLLFFTIFLVMLYAATERVSWLIIGLLMFLVGAYVCYLAFGHVRLRVDIWLHPFRGKLPDGSSYQLVQGLFGLGTGGLFGTGLGKGSPDIVPFSQSDFILSSLGEEIGAMGVMALLVLYGVLVARGLRTALGVRDEFGKLLGTGLAAAFAIQVFVVCGGVLRVIPLTGLPLPFLAYGGSSLVANAMLIALLLRISDAGRRPPPPPSAVGPLFDPKAIADTPTQVVRL